MGIFCKSKSLIILDNQLPADSFTYLCPAKNSTSWLDHIVCAQEMKGKILDVTINYETALYDHFPLFFFLDITFDTWPVSDKEVVIREFVNWNKMTTLDERWSMWECVRRKCA